MFRLTFSALLLTGWLASSALAAETPQAIKCINILNKGMAKLAGTASKTIQKCLKSYAKNPALSDPDECVFDSGNKIAVGLLKLELKAVVVCSNAGVPNIGPYDSQIVGYSGAISAVNVAAALVAGDLDSFYEGALTCTTAPAKAGCKCQDALLSKSGKLLLAYLELFNNCKKDGLASGLISTPEDIETCLTSPNRLDPDGKLAKEIAKLGAKVDKACGSPVTNPLPNGYCTGLTGADLTSCIHSWVRCSACAALNQADDLNMDCDTFDGGEVDSCGLVSGGTLP